jgi:predicted dienelactone hydrolase
LVLFFKKELCFFWPFFLIAAAAQPGIDAPALAPLGPYGAGVAALDIVQPSQLDPLLGTTSPKRVARELPLRVWYPARAGGSPITYASSLAGPDGKPAAFTIPGIAVENAAAAPGKFPLVLVAHGYGNNPEVMAWLCENLATKGYVVASAAFRDPPVFSQANLGAVIARRPLDIAFLAAEARRRALAGRAPFAHADPDHVALIGYSMGGYGVLTAAGAALNPALAPATQGILAPYVAGAPQADDIKLGNLKAVVAIAPPWRLGPLNMWTPTGLADIHVPTFIIGGSQDHTVGYAGIHTIFESATGAPRYLLTFREAGHDIGLSGAPPAMRKRLWDQSWFEDPVWRNDRITAIEEHFITAFLDRYVKGDMTKAAYIDGLVTNSDDGTWPDDKIPFDAISPGPPAVTLWKGFRRNQATGMTLEFSKAK